MTTKEKVLNLLEQNKGTHISGTAIAKELDVSRNSVWKAIKQLEKDGFDIEAGTNKGYCLNKNSDMISVSGIKPFLHEPEKVTDIHYYSVVDSTNKVAKELAMNGADHGTIVIANEQTAGKGRYGRHFESPGDKGVYMSIVMKPEKLLFSTPTLITSFVAVEVCQVIEEMTGKKAGIKWVNDIFLEGKKVCGILTEAVTNFESGQIEWIVVGIGINMTTRQTDFSSEVSQVATSIFSDETMTITRNELIGQLINHLLTKQSEHEMMTAYKERSIVLNKKVDVLQGKQQFEATVKDIDAIGRLVVEKEDGQVFSLNSGEVRIKTK